MNCEGGETPKGDKEGETQKREDKQLCGEEGELLRAGENSTGKQRHSEGKTP